MLGNVSVVNWGGKDRFAAKGEWVAGTNIAFRVEALNAAGGFAVNLGRTRGGQSLLSNDETDVIDRMIAKGGKLVYSPDAAVGHLVPSERLTQAWFRRRVAWQAVSDPCLNRKACSRKAPGYWRGVTEYYAPSCRRSTGTPRGLHIEQLDPEYVPACRCPPSTSHRRRCSPASTGSGERLSGDRTRTEPLEACAPGRASLVLSPTPTHPQDFGNRKRIFQHLPPLSPSQEARHLPPLSVRKLEWRTSSFPSADQRAIGAAWDRILHHSRQPAGLIPIPSMYLSWHR